MFGENASAGNTPPPCTHTHTLSTLDRRAHGSSKTLVLLEYLVALRIAALTAVTSDSVFKRKVRRHGGPKMGLFCIMYR